MLINHTKNIDKIIELKILKMVHINLVKLKFQIKILVCAKFTWKSFCSFHAHIQNSCSYFYIKSRKTIIVDIVVKNKQQKHNKKEMEKNYKLHTLK